jgi:hypothetical protein
MAFLCPFQCQLIGCFQALIPGSNSYGLQAGKEKIVSPDLAYKIWNLDV